MDKISNRERDRAENILAELPDGPENIPTDRDHGFYAGFYAACTVASLIHSNYMLALIYGKLCDIEEKINART